jgi:Zn-dependent peptidase ImmA (M78 family)
MATIGRAAAVRKGTMAASRLHQRLAWREDIEANGGNVDVFGAIHKVDLPLLLRPLKGLLGAYLSEPASGVLVTTLRPMSVQRFTAAHELGHFSMQHRPSLDDEGILRRMPLAGLPDVPREASSAAGAESAEVQEVEADAFAVEFMMPRWLIHWHASRQGWKSVDFRQPACVYQLALRIGASYEATCWTLVRHGLITRHTARQLLTREPKDIKTALLTSYRPQDYRGDVWLLTERDAGTRINGSRKDLFVLRLEEHSGGGYLWDFDRLKTSGFAIVRDEVESSDADGVGGPVMRRVTALTAEPYRGRLAFDERRPWEPDEPIASIEVDVDLTGPEEEGLSRVERRSLLQAA